MRPQWLALALLLAGGCDRLPYGSGSDVAAILRAHGVKPGRLRCVNPTLGGQVVRAVACTATLTPTELGTLSAEVPLARGNPLHARGGYAGTCEATPGLRSTDPGVEVLAGTNRRVRNGVNRIAVHVVRASGAACIEIEYPWSS